MSSLTDTEKRYLEKLLDMGGGYVLDYNNATFGQFFRRHNVDIHGRTYQTSGTSKAHKLRAFWSTEPDQLVGAVLSEMLESYVTACELGGEDVNQVLLARARSVVIRLTGHPSAVDSTARDAEFMEREFAVPDIRELPLEARIVPIVEERLREVRVTLQAGAYLSVILLCGSVLEAILLGAAKRDPASFNQAKATPRTKAGSPKPFRQWSLARLIDVASELKVIKPDVKKFSHGLRDFRNYIHPDQQLRSGFTPDQHTARVCVQVLRAALASVAGKR